MKKLFLALFAFAVAIIADAQVTHTQDGHLLLYGLSLNSTLEQRMENLAKNGFNFQKMEGDDLVYRGKFCGMPCEASVKYEKSSSRVTELTFTIFIQDAGWTGNAVKKLESDFRPALGRYLREDMSDVARESLREGNANEEEIRSAYSVIYVNRHDEAAYFVSLGARSGGVTFFLGEEGTYESMK